MTTDLNEKLDVLSKLAAAAVGMDRHWHLMEFYVA
jgi:hypothetical protein